MPTVLHPILGELDPSAPGFWDTTLTFAGRTITFDLTIDGSGLTGPDLNDLPRQLEDLVPFYRAARFAILRDAQARDDDAASTLYLTHHGSELPTADLQRLFGTDKPGSADPEAMLSRLVLVRVGLYPEHEDRRVLLDYSIDPDVTHYLLCVSFDAARQPTAVALES